MRPGFAAAGLVLALAGCGGTTAPAPSAPAPGTTATVAADDFRSVRTYRTVAVPTRLRIPAAGVDTPLERLGRAADRSITLPSRPELAGWFSGGPRPGQPGPAVIIGHVDWDHAPAVFFRLRHLSPGDLVTVDRSDRSAARFRVTRLEQVAKAEFPTETVYAPDLEPSLRLITCGGDFDRTSRNYLDNVIVFASPV